MQTEGRMEAYWRQNRGRIVAESMLKFSREYQEMEGFTPNVRIQSRRWHDVMRHEMKVMREVFGHDNKKRQSKLSGWMASQGERDHLAKAFAKAAALTPEEIAAAAQLQGGSARNRALQSLQQHLTQPPQQHQHQHQHHREGRLAEGEPPIASAAVRASGRGGECILYLYIDAANYQGPNCG